MKATLDNFLVKWDGNNPLWKELIEWLNKTYSKYLKGESSIAFYGLINGASAIKLNDEIVDRSIIITLEQWKELLKPKTMNNFKKGDKVFVYPYGWCEYCHESVNVGKVVVKYKFIYHEVDIFLVSFTEYTLQGFTQERPFEPKIGEKYFFWNDETINDDCVGYGRLKQISNNINFPYFFGTKYFQFCSKTNPLL
jgi:hypothetical protein